MGTQTESQHAYHVGAASGSYSLIVYECGNCGVMWGMTEQYIEARKKDGKGWRCPNGHSWVFNSGDSVEERLKRELKEERDATARERARLDQARAEATAVQHTLRTTRGHVTRQRKKLERVANGVCPCCNRSFANLGRHMETKHPEYAP